MKSEEISDELILTYLEGTPNRELEQLLEVDELFATRVSELKEVLNAMEGSPGLEVPVHIGVNLQQAILDEQSKKKSNYSWMQVAAAVTILIVGFALGRTSGNDSSEELASLRMEIQSLKEVTLTNTLERHSASERILAVSQIEASTQKINRELAATLINTLNADESPNVRYAALQALGKFIDNSDIRAALVKSLENQQDALIQISLISLLVEAEERSAIAPLKDMVEDELLSPDVKRQAEIAIQVLT